MRDERIQSSDTGVEPATSGVASESGHGVSETHSDNSGRADPIALASRDRAERRRADARESLPVMPASVTSRRRSRRRRFGSWRNRLSGQPIATLCLGVLILGAPQLLGGVLPWTINVIAAASFVCLAVVGLGAPAASRRFPRLGWALLGACAFTLLQAVPLPCSWVALVAPDSAQKLRAVNALLGAAPPSLCTLSQAPGATHEEVVKHLAWFATFTACWIFAASGGRRALFWLIAGSALAMSVVALAHGVFEIDRVFGVYQPEGLARTLLFAPLMNPNNLGGFVAIGPPLWVGLTYRDENPSIRVFGYIAIALTSAAAVLSLSRGAIAQLLASSLVMVWLMLRQRNHKGRRPDASLRELGLLTASAAGLGLGAYIAGREVIADFGASKLEKLDLIARALHFAVVHPLTGVGRGAFASSFVAFAGSTVRYRYAENWVAQWAADWGLPLALGLIGLIGLELVQALKLSHRSLARLGAFTALGAWCAQNLLDFGFELVGLSVIASALLAACVAPSAAVIAATEPAPVLWRRGSFVSGAALIGALVLYAWLGPKLPGETLPALEARLRQAQTSPDRGAFKRQLAAALRLHPAEPNLTLLAASEAAARRDPRTLAWLNRAMQLAPGWARPHQLAFRWLWQRGQGRQALLELKTAAAIDIDVATEDVCRLGRVDASWALGVAPHSDRRATFFERVSGCLYGAPSSEAFDDALLREFPGEKNALAHRAMRLIERGRADESLALFDELQRTHPDFQVAIIMKFETLLRLSRWKQMLDESDIALATLDEEHQVQLLSLKAQALARAGTPDLAYATLSEIRRRASSNPQRLAQSYELEGRIHWERREAGEALAAYRQAFKISSDNAYLRNIATAAESVGDRSQALWAYIHLCQREPRGDGCARRDALLEGQGLNLGR
jgi:tetratricopeptide (TPR) repeat protein